MNLFSNFEKIGSCFQIVVAFLEYMNFTVHLKPTYVFRSFRLHTQVSGSFQLKDENHTVVATAPLKDLFHLPHTLLVDNTYDQLLRGQSSQSVQVRKFK